MLNVKRPLEAMVLAAGRGSRFGGDKLLASWRGGVLLDGALKSAFATTARSVHLVVGQGAQAVGQAAIAWAQRAGAADRLVVVEARGWEQGLSASLKAGVAVLRPDTFGVYVFLGDMPCVPRAVLDPLADALIQGAPAAVPTFDGLPGHPALLGAALFPHIADLSGDRGARGLLDGLGEALARVPVDDDGVLFDVDTPDALASA